jgi:PIN domain nuclease of toxin-antitoxin system
LILLDTHVLVWLAVEPRRLSRRAVAAIQSGFASGGVGIASISLWELAMLFVRGRLRAPGTPDAAIRQLVEQTSVSVHEITPEIAVLSAQFPEGFPADPADRLIAATARAHGIPLVTRDARIRTSPLLQSIW